MPDGVFDVVVVGGGLSGLAAARRLGDAGQRVAVVEARDRLGGRTSTVVHAGHTVDVGGQWVGPGQDRVLALIDELGFSTYPQHTTGLQTVEIDGRITRYRGLLPKVGVRALIELGVSLTKINGGAKRIPTDAPWDAPGATDFDALSVQGWIEKTMKTRNAQQMFRIATNAIMAEEPARISWLHMLFYTAAAGSFEKLAEVRGGAQQDRIKGGAQQLSEGLAKRGKAEVCLSHPVKRIAQNDDGVEVVTERGTFRGKYVVLALAPAMCEAIEFVPALPVARAELHRSMKMGSAAKCIVGYDRPFWREQGFNGQGVSNGSGARLFFDVCSDDGETVAMVAFLFSDAARAFAQKPEGERRKLVIADLTRLFGPEAGHARWYIDKNWTADPYAGGCYTGLFSPGDFTRLGAALRQPCGRLHFAGTESAKIWPGYMDGAIESGERAADEVLARV